MGDRGKGEKGDKRDKGDKGLEVTTNAPDITVKRLRNGVCHDCNYGE
jgi:hypothetical protein